MAWRYVEDGECAKCGMHTNRFCDACKRYFCDEHLHQWSNKGDATTHEMCRECYEAGKEKTHVQFKGKHAHYAN